jgi:hypothetical protein
MVFTSRKEATAGTVSNVLRFSNAEIPESRVYA